MKKRILAFLMTVMMVVTMVPLSAYASDVDEYALGDGSIIGGIEDVIELAGGGGFGGGGQGGTSDAKTLDWLLFEGYDSNFWCQKPSSSNYPKSSEVTVKLNGDDWTYGTTKEPSAVKKGTVTITPPNGWYVRQVVICCDDEGGYECKANGRGTVERKNYSIDDYAEDPTITVDLSSDSCWHKGQGSDHHLMIWLEKCPNPVTVKYVSGLTGYTGTAVEDGDLFTYNYETTMPTHTILPISDALATYAKENGKKFTGWELTFYTDSDYSDAHTDPVDKKVNDTFTVYTYALLEAQWEEVEYHNVTYIWDGDIPVGVTLPEDKGLYAEGDTYTVDSTYDSDSTVYTYDEYKNIDGKYTFSGWKLNGKGDVVTGEQTMGDNNVTLVGVWTYEDVELTTYQIEYKWDGTEPTGEYAQTLPTDPTDYVLNQPYEVNTEFTKDETKVPNVNDNNVAIGAWVFKGWDTEDGIITGNLTITGTWSYEAYPYEMEPTGSIYKVEYYLETLTDGEYELKDSYYKSCIKIGETVTAEEKSYTGFTYNEDISKASGEVFVTIPEEGSTAEVEYLILKLYYDRDSYKVTYEYTNDPAPTDATKLPVPAEYKYGETVTVAEKATATGYTFSGWTTTDVTVSDHGTFTMPANNVTIKGSFNPNTGTAYKIEYYLETLNGDGFELNSDATENLTGTTGSTVEVTDNYKKSFTGFTFDENNTNNVLSGTVAADGSLVLKLYYDRDSYEVSYEYTGTVPTDATKLPVITEYKYGETVKVAEKATAKGYTFSGWNTVAKITLNTDGKFEMPAYDVMFYGSFEPADGTAYKVEHHLETGYNTGKYDLKDTETLYGKTGDMTEAKAKVYEGYTAKDFDQEKIKADGSTVVAIYYTLNKADTYTVTYMVDDKIIGEVEVYEAGDVVTVRKPLPDKQLYTFEGWYYPTYITVKNGKFEMPARDVIIRGTYEYEGLYIPPITEGYIEIEKELTAPKNYKGATTFTFEIYKDGNDEDDLYTVVKVKAGESTKVKVDVGTYYIYEVDAEEDGYTLTTGCNAQNNRIRVEGGKTRTVTFKNVYTEEILLEKDDHFGYIIGYPDDTVRPESNITRAEIATIFFRMLTDESRAEYWSQTNDFTDVSRSDWFNNAVSTLANAGILSGYADGSFRPNESITRAELVKIAVAFYGSDAAVEADFNDTDDHWADMFINAAYGLGFVNGYEDGSFRPDQAVTRAEAMKIINRSLGRYPTVYGLHSDMIIWKDNRDKSAWYYADVQEATNSHEYVWETDTAEDWTDILPIRDWAALEKIYSDAYDG